MAPAEGSYAPRSPDLSFLSSGADQPPPPPLHVYNQHARTPSAEYSSHHQSALAYPPPNGAGYYHGGPPAHSFAASPSPSYSYGSLPPQPQPQQPPQPHPSHPLQPHMASPPPPHPAPGLSRQPPIAPPATQLYYHDPTSYNANPALPPYPPHHQQSPYQGAHSSHPHASSTPPQHQHQHQHQHHYSPQRHAQHLGHSPPQQAPHLPAHLQSPQLPAGYPRTTFTSIESYPQHAQPTESQSYPRSGPLDISSSAYPAAQSSNATAADHGLAVPQHGSFNEMPPQPTTPAKEPEIMFSPVKTKFPTARIKRIMQADEEVGKVAQQTPIAVGKALELFMVQLVTKSADVARDRNSKRITAQMLKQVIDSGQEWDFLQDIVAKVSDDKEGAKGSAKAKAESESDEEIEPAEPKKRGRGTGRKKKNAE
ncbi:Dr1-associated corepressor [Microdochium nivale]|nr:Dr1-associated corepressor [Microdochium nivale]